MILDEAENQKVDWDINQKRFSEQSEKDSQEALN